IFDGNCWIAYGGDRRKQVESAAEFLVKDGSGQIVAARRAAAQKEPAAHPIIRLVDRDVLAGHPRVPDEIRGRRQSAKAATDDMRLHPPPPWTPSSGGPPDPSPLKQATGRELSKRQSHVTVRRVALADVLAVSVDELYQRRVSPARLDCPVTMSLFDQGVSGPMMMMTSIAVSPSMADIAPRLRMACLPTPDLNRLRLP